MEDGAKFTGKIRIEKRLAVINLETHPYSIIECKNIGLTSGLTEMLKIFSGTGGTAFNNAYTQIGVGDSLTAPNAAQTDLQAATNKTYVSMNPGWPGTPASPTVTYQATFGGGVANYAWNEFVIKNLSSGICINRSTNSGAGFGTKVGGTIWIAAATFSLS